MTDQTALPPLLAAARALELDRDAASTAESADYRRGMTRAVKLLRLLNEDEPAAVPVPPPADQTAGWLDAATEIRAAAFREAADIVAAHPGPIPYRPQLDEDGGFWWDTRDRDAVAALLRRVAAEEQPAETGDGRGLMRAHAALAEQAGRDQRALARIRQMADAWEQRLPEVIRTPAVVSAIRSALPDETDRPKLPPMDPVHILGIDAAPARPAERPHCPHCQLPHDLTPDSLPATVCASTRQHIADAAQAHTAGDHSGCCRVDCEALQAVGEQPETQEADRG